MPKWSRWSDAKEAQYRELSEEKCPDTYIRPMQGSANPKHGLQAVTTHSLRDLFRKRHEWHCHFCDLRVRVVE